MKQKILKVFLGIVVGIVIVLSSIILFFKYEFDWKRTTIAKFENQENGYSVVFQEIGSAFLFGSSDVRVLLKDERGKVVDKIVSEIGNDGSTLGKWNITVSWTHTGVHITFHGQEQKDEFHEMYW